VWLKSRRAVDSSLRDAIDASQKPRHACSAPLSRASLNKNERYDRLIVMMDEQRIDTVSAPKGKGICDHVASYKNGVGYGKWTHIAGWSEAVIEYIRALESPVQWVGKLTVEYAATPRLFSSFFNLLCFQLLFLAARGRRCTALLGELVSVILSCAGADGGFGCGLPSDRARLRSGLGTADWIDHTVWAPRPASFIGRFCRAL